MPATPIHRFQNPQPNPFGPTPSSVDQPHLHRPKSSSSLPYARPPNPTSVAGGSIPPPPLHQQHQQPIMVALSGWPEPVYVAESKEVARRRSRAGTPVLQPLTTGMGDGVDLSMLPSLGNGSRPPASREYENRYREERSPYPVSSTRSTRTSPVRSIPSSPTLHAHGHSSHRQSSPHHDSYPHPPLPKGYHDPRYGPTAALHDRALRVVPAWSSSSAPYRENVGVGMRVPAGQRGEGLLVMRAVPDVYPPPGRVLASAGGVAKEVYPRDPNNAFLWGGGAGGGAATPSSSGMMSPTRHSDVKDEDMNPER